MVVHAQYCERRKVYWKSYAHHAHVKKYAKKFAAKLQVLNERHNQRESSTHLLSPAH